VLQEEAADAERLEPLQVRRTLRHQGVRPVAVQVGRQPTAAAAGQQHVLGLPHTVRPLRVQQGLKDRVADPAAAEVDRYRWLLRARVVGHHQRVGHIAGEAGINDGG